VSVDKRKGRPQEHDRAAVLAAAREVAGQRGYDNLRFVDIANATGVAVSSLQYAFGTREALVREVLRSGVRGELDRLQAAVAKASDPWGQVQAFIKAGISTDERQRREGWLLWMEFWRAGLRDPQLRTEAFEVSRLWRHILVSPIEAGTQSGEFVLTTSSLDAAAAIVGVVDGLSRQVEVGDRHMRVTHARRVALAAARQILGVRTP
jgi:AcrR family transcriptional regulator